MAAGKARVTRIPVWVCQERATPPDAAKCSCPAGGVAFLPWGALLLGRPAVAGRICFLVDALPKPKIESHAAPPIYEMASSHMLRGFFHPHGPFNDGMPRRWTWTMRAKPLCAVRLSIFGKSYSVFSHFDRNQAIGNESSLSPEGFGKYGKSRLTIR